MGRLSDTILALFGEKSTENRSPSSSQPAAGGLLRDKNEPTSHVGDTELSSSSEDCLSCKVIGTGTLLAASSYVMYSTVKGRSNFKGMRRVFFFGQGISLTTLLLILAGSRAFDRGLFDKNRTEETLLQGCKSDLKYMILSLGYDLPTFLQDSQESPK